MTNRYMLDSANGLMVDSPAACSSCSSTCTLSYVSLNFLLFFFYNHSGDWWALSELKMFEISKDHSGAERLGGLSIIMKRKAVPRADCGGNYSMLKTGIKSIVCNNHLSMSNFLLRLLRCYEEDKRSFWLLTCSSSDPLGQTMILQDSVDLNDWNSSVLIVCSFTNSR